MNQHYDDYEEEDFLLDESFARYCLGTDALAVRYWNDWIERHPGKEELVAKAKQLFLLLNGDNNAQQFKRHEQLFRERFQEHLQQSRWQAASVTYTKQDQPKSLFKKLLLYASPVLLAFCAIIIWGTKKNSNEKTAAVVPYTSETNYGEHKSLQLADGTKITLNAGTKITVSPQFNEKLREITLDGEAFLDVTHNPGKPFVIHTPSMDVRVLGTVLNVRAYSHDKKAETSLIRGMVEVTMKDEANHKVILHPNEKIVIRQTPYNTNAVQQKAVKPHADSNYEIRQLVASPKDSAVSEILWTKAKLVFDDENFEDIAAMLERDFAVTIILSDEVKDFRYTGTFDRKSIEEILNALQLSRYFEYKISADKHITIAKKIN